MNPSTLSMLLLVTACCFLFIEVATGEDNSVTSEFDSPGFLTDKKAIRSYIKKADNKVKAVHDVHAMMVAKGLNKRAKKFMKREKTRLEKYKQKLRNDRRKNGISKRTDSRPGGNYAGNARRG
ncbi:uncharacterized protein [Branchiostoma lanceolatum]|uniref:uncharacterized protein isoform X1 n=1 Tax=Branchiostoma lanceolatum TaxID=7740 RepID=UPI0034523960